MTPSGPRAGFLSAAALMMRYTPSDTDASLWARSLPPASAYSRLVPRDRVEHVVC